MGIITLEFDNTLEKSEIVVPLVSSSKDEAGDNYSSYGMTEAAQTKVFGIMCPLVMVNNTVINYDEIISFTLDSEGPLPSVSMTVKDTNGFIRNVDKVKHGAEIRVQILPRFENAYKKIDLTFYITDISNRGDYIDVRGAYKVPKLTQSQLMGLGRQSTYSLFKSIAQYANLGFASNITSTNDAHYIYCNNKSLLSALNEAISVSDSTNHILSWWVDFWDNINLVDVKERYNTVDSDEDMLVWVAGNLDDVTADVEVQPTQLSAAISDHPMLSNSELYVSNYSEEVSPGGQLFGGTDTVISIYDNNSQKTSDYLFQDGDIKNDISIQYAYKGEYYGDYNYILAPVYRSTYFTKMNSSKVKVTLNSPLLGLMRGHKVNFMHYVNDSNLENRLQNLEEIGIVNRENVKSNIDLNDYDVRTGNPDGEFILDKTISGQYLIESVSIEYSYGKWYYELTLIKPTATAGSILTVDPYEGK